MAITQELQVSSKKKPIYVLKFNHDGKLLAAAGKEGIITVWVVEKFRADFEGIKKEPTLAQTKNIFDLNPLRTYDDHTKHVLDLSWSHKAGENWLLSASMDKSVRLWHLTKENSLLEFTHSETVKCVAFHPEENSLFVSGSLDGKIRVWNVPEQRTICSESVTPRWKNGEMITAICFAKKAQWILVGTYDGRCIVFETEKLAFYTEFKQASDRP